MAFTGKISGADGIRHVSNGEVKLHIPVQEAKEDWAPRIGPHGGKIWRNSKTGDEHYGQHPPFGRPSHPAQEQPAGGGGLAAYQEQGDYGSETRTKRDMTRHIAELTGLPQHKTKAVLQHAFHAISDTLLTDGRVELRGFGVFKVVSRNPRRRRDPRNDQPIDVPARYVIKFKPGKEMANHLREMSEEELG